MLYKAISLALAAVLLHGSIAAQDQPQSPRQTVAKMQEVLHKAQEKDKAVKVTLKNKRDNQKKFSGKVSHISDTGFTITNQNAGNIVEFGYEDVKEVRPKWMSTGEKIGTGVVIAGLFVLTMTLLWVAGVIRGND